MRGLKEGIKMDKRPIGVFDSGLGGLTCVRKILKTMPGEDVIYFGDTGRVPYGTRSRDTIIKYVRQDIRFLEEFDIKMIIIACGTASSAALPWLADEIKTPITGVVEPAVARAVSATKNNKIGVIGTSGTVRSGKYPEYIEKMNKDIQVIQRDCPMFVPLVENGYLDADATREFAREYLEEIKAFGVDTLILGCTHYPLLTKVIKEEMGDSVTLIDSGAAAADYSYEILKERNMLSDKKKGNIRFFVSDGTENFSRLGEMFLDRKIDGSVAMVDIEKY